MSPRVIFTIVLCSQKMYPYKDGLSLDVIKGFKYYVDASNKQSRFVISCTLNEPLIGCSTDEIRNKLRKKLKLVPLINRCELVSEYSSNNLYYISYII